MPTAFDVTNHNRDSAHHTGCIRDMPRSHPRISRQIRLQRSPPYSLDSKSELIIIMSALLVRYTVKHVQNTQHVIFRIAYATPYAIRKIRTELKSAVQRIEVAFENSVHTVPYKRTHVRNSLVPRCRRLGPGNETIKHVCGAESNLSVSLAVLVLLMVGMDNEDGTWGYYDPHPYSSFSYNYYGSSHLQQFPHYKCAPIRVSQTSEAKGGEPSSHHSFILRLHWAPVLSGACSTVLKRAFTLRYRTRAANRVVLFPSQRTAAWERGQLFNHVRQL